MLELPEKHKERDSKTVIRFYEDGEEIAELVDAGIPAPSEGDYVNLHETELLEGPANPDLISVEDDSEWGGTGRHCKVQKAEYHIDRKTFPNDFGEPVSQYVTIINIYLENIMTN